MRQVNEMNLKKETASAILMKILISFIVIASLVFALFPFYWILNTSFKTVQDSVRVPIHYYPHTFTLKNYADVWNLTPFPYYFRNSLIVSILTGLLTVFCSIFAAYSLSRFRFRGKNVVLSSFLITQMIPALTMIVPLFVIFNTLGLIDTLTSLIIPYTVTSIPFCTMMLVGFFKQVPSALEDAAAIDGCNRLHALFRVIIPVMATGIVAAFVFAFIGAWNELFFSIMFINSNKLKTIPAGISLFIQKVDINWVMLAAGAMISVLPVIVLFFMIQKYLIQGLSMGSVKG
jgi:multiple sugar transport system permease protein